MTDTVVRYEPRGGARTLLKARTSEVLISGPAGTGKSLAALFKVHLACLNTPGIRCLIVRKTAVSLTSTTLVTYKKKVAADALRANIVHWYGGSPSEAASFVYSNGSVIVVGGMDKPDRVLSSEYDLIFADEATELTITDWETLGTRLRNNVLSFQQQIAACNPSYPTHWIKQRADGGSMQKIVSRHVDNPAYVNADGSFTDKGGEYLSKLDALTGVRRLRLRDGIWAAAEGVIYDEFEEDVHVIDPFEIPNDWPLYLSIDFGFVNPFVCQWWRVDGDGRMYLTREVYHSGIITDDHAKNIMQIMADHPEEPPPTAVVADHDANERQVMRNYLGFSTKAARKAVDVGIQNMQKRFRVQGDGRPRVFFFRDAVTKRDPSLHDAGRPASTVEELPGYIWDATGTKGPKEAPLKLNDHGCDAMRYMAARLDRVRES
jgi:phage terminase large subunit